jgi:hypothetical protein
VGVLVTRHVAFALGAALLVRPLAAQLPAADQAFQRGDYAAARASYERVLASDSTSQRALYRLAILDSWDGKLVRSLARFVRLRRIDPRPRHHGDARAGPGVGGQDGVVGSVV